MFDTVFFFSTQLHHFDQRHTRDKTQIEFPTVEKLNQPFFNCKKTPENESKDGRSIFFQQRRLTKKLTKIFTVIVQMFRPKMLNLVEVKKDNFVRWFRERETASLLRLFCIFSSQKGAQQKKLFDFCLHLDFNSFLKCLLRAWFFGFECCWIFEFVRSSELTSPSKCFSPWMITLGKVISDAKHRLG